MQHTTLLRFAGCLALGICMQISANAQRVIHPSAEPEVAAVPSRVIGRVDETNLVKLTGNTNNLARPKFDQGLLDPSKSLAKMVLVLQRSPEQEQALAAFNERQTNPKSADFHHWLHAEEFGRMYGPSDSDMAAVTSWLQNRGFVINEVSKGRTWIQFTGSVAQVQDTFHVEMHRYHVENKDHIANDRDPQIPAALAPVVAGVASLHDFFGHHQSWLGNFVKRDTRTGKITKYDPPQIPFVDDPIETEPFEVTGHDGKLTGVRDRPLPFQVAQPELTYTDGNNLIHEDLTPFDFAAVYNIAPLWKSGIIGSGVAVAIVATSDVTLSDVATYRSSFNLPSTTVKVIQTDPATDPGVTDPGENTEDLEMVSASAPGATLDLVVAASTSTSPGFELSDAYIIDKEIAPILTASYGICELAMGTAGNKNINQIWQQGATEGISIFSASGDSGSATCDSQNAAAPVVDGFGLEVSGYASSPYVTAVGGTDFSWSFGTKPISTYWNQNNDANLATAKGYIPEITWNTTCSNPLLLNIFVDNSGNPEFSNNEDLCNAALNSANYQGLVKFSSSGGGVSHCTTNNTPPNPTSLNPSSCSGGYAKPSWQTGPGVPADGKRDVPDIAMFGSYGFGGNGFPAGVEIDSTAILICVSYPTHGIKCAKSDYTDPNQIIYQENGGTSAASPFAAGVMALVLQKTGQVQGLANPVFYEMAAKQSTSTCNATTVAAGNACYFHDITQGSNSQVCGTGNVNCVTNTSGDQIGLLAGYKAGSGYDLTTGVGSMNVTNIVNGWSSFVKTPIVKLTPPSVSFPSTAVGTVSSTIEKVTISNIGTAAASLSTLEITGADATSYTIASTGASACTGTIAIGASCVVEISFKPTAQRQLLATLEVIDNAGTQTAKITGTGVPQAGTPKVTLTPTSLTFPSTAQGKVSPAQVVTIKNTGTAALTLGATSFTGTNTKAFVVSAKSCGSSLAVNASCTISIEFAPPVTGALSASLSIADNAAGSPQAVTLKGTATPPVTGTTVTLTPSSLVFPATILGTTSDAQIVTLTNTGKASVSVSSITIIGANPAAFLELGTCGTTLGAGAKCSLYVAFKPASAAALSAALQVTDTAGSPQKVTLTGTGVAAPSVKLSVTSLSFPVTKHGTTSAAQTVTLTNTGKATLDLKSITLAGPNPAAFEELDTCPATLAPAGNCMVYLAFKPAAAGAFKAMLSIADNGGASPQSVALSGTGN